MTEATNNSQPSAPDAPGVPDVPQVVHDVTETPNFTVLNNGIPVQVDGYARFSDNPNRIVITVNLKP